jgi:hypothetical protein
MKRRCNSTSFSVPDWEGRHGLGVAHAGDPSYGRLHSLGFFLCTAGLGEGEFGNVFCQVFTNIPQIPRSRKEQQQKKMFMTN